MWLLLLTVPASFLLSGSVCWGLSHYRGRWSALDHPNHRSLHSEPVSRLGGLGLIVGMGSASLLLYFLEGQGLFNILLPAILGFSIITFTSLLDDFYRLPMLPRLLSHLVAAMFVANCTFSLTRISFAAWYWQPPVWLITAFVVAFVVWMVNLYNFMDGMDGFASGMGLIGFGTFAIFGYMAGARGFGALSASVAAACAGVLLLNFPPARLFMGDAGATGLGFLAAVFMLWANQRDIFPLWIGLLVFSPFIADASWTLLQRAFRGKIPWRAHREHFYQRLVQFGWGHRKTLMLEYGLMVSCSIVAIGLHMADSTAIQVWGAGIILIGYVGMGLWLHMAELAIKRKGVSL